MFRSKKLDLGCFVNIKVIRDHTKRKVFAEHDAIEISLLVADAFMGVYVLLETLLKFWYLQASPAICHSQPESTSQNTRASTATISPDALLHTADANSE
jgi:hypothetical protein